jgi:CTP synthase (UTP-ammonia lyase)
MPCLALIGDYDPAIVAHQAIPLSLTLAAKNTGVPLTWEWIGTEALGDASHQLAAYDGVWCVPGSPYRNMDGALAAIRFARETPRPFLGTCGGFQHALIEIARHVAGVAGADHAETNAAAADLVVIPLACSLVGRQGDITVTPGSHLHGLFAGQPSREGYHCNYGPNPAYRARLEAAGLRFTGFDADRQIRAFELSAHPFFVGTLFQPERSSLTGRKHPLIEGFVQAIQAHI